MTSKFSEMKFGLYPTADFNTPYSALVALVVDFLQLAVAAKVTTSLF